MPDTDAVNQLVVFSLAGEHYAFPINAVSEIIRYTPPHDMSSDEPALQGIIGLRGKIIPIVDLATRLRIVTGDTAPGKIVIVETSTGNVGVIVDDVDEVRTVTTDQVEDSPADTHGTIAKLDDRIVIIIEPEELLVGVEAAALG